MTPEHTQFTCVHISTLDERLMYQFIGARIEFLIDISLVCALNVVCGVHMPKWYFSRWCERRTHILCMTCRILLNVSMSTTNKSAQHSVPLVARVFRPPKKRLKKMCVLYVPESTKHKSSGPSDCKLNGFEKR